MRRFYLLFLFCLIALLQSLMPFLHMHPGNSPLNGFHIHFISAHHSEASRLTSAGSQNIQRSVGPSSTRLTAFSRIEVDDLPEISMPSSLFRDDDHRLTPNEVLLALLCCLGYFLLVQTVVVKQPSRGFFYSPQTRVSAYFSPPSLAPPLPH